MEMQSRQLLIPLSIWFCKINSGIIVKIYEILPFHRNINDPKLTSESCFHFTFLIIELNLILFYRSISKVSNCAVQMSGLSHHLQLVLLQLFYFLYIF